MSWVKKERENGRTPGKREEGWGTVLAIQTSQLADAMTGVFSLMKHGCTGTVEGGGKGGVTRMAAREFLG